MHPKKRFPLQTLGGRLVDETSCNRYAISPLTIFTIPVGHQEIAGAFDAFVMLLSVMPALADGAVGSGVIRLTVALQEVRLTSAVSGGIVRPVRIAHTVRRHVWVRSIEMEGLAVSVLFVSVRDGHLQGVQHFLVEVGHS